VILTSFAAAVVVNDSAVALAALSGTSTGLVAEVQLLALNAYASNDSAEALDDTAMIATNSARARLIFFNAKNFISYPFDLNFRTPFVP
jgi:hypothetical protein